MDVKKSRLDLPLVQEYFDMLHMIMKHTGTKRYSDTIRICIVAYLQHMEIIGKLKKENEQLKIQMKKDKNN